MLTSTDSRPAAPRTPRRDAVEPADGAGALALRPIAPGDEDAVARIVHAAFAGVHDRHGFPRDFPTLDAARGVVDAFVANPGIWGVVAERDGRLIGSNFLDERGPVRGVGPITVDPAVQAGGVGRRLMQAVIQRGARADGIRLLQDSFNTASLALYASLGFEADEPVALMTGRAAARPLAAVDAVRRVTDTDLGAADRLHRAVHGFSRAAELRDGLTGGGMRPLAAVRRGRIVAYATTLSHFAFAHAVAETPADMTALIAGAAPAGEETLSFLLPIRQHELVRWCLAAGLRVVKPMTYMAMGAHRRPTGAWIPSVLY